MCDHSHTDALFVHGADDSPQIWDPVITLLSAHGIGAVVGGYPWGRFGDPTWSMDKTSGDLVQADLNRHRPRVCVAHSFGCLALLEALSSDTEGARPAAVVLVSPFYLSHSEPVTWELVDRTRSEFIALLRRSVVSRSTSVGRALSDESVDLITDKLTTQMNPLGFISLFTSFVLVRERNLESITMPVEIVAAEDDPGLRGMARRDELSRRLRASSTVVEGDDHFIHYNQPTLIVDAIVRTGCVPREYTQRKDDES